MSEQEHKESNAELCGFQIVKRETVAGSILKEQSIQIRSDTLLDCLLCLDMIDPDTIKNKETFNKIKGQVKLNKNETP